MILEDITLTHKSKQDNNLLNKEVSIPFISLFQLNVNNIIIIKDFLESFEDGSWLDKAQNNVETELSKWK